MEIKLQDLIQLTGYVEDDAVVLNDHAKLIANWVPSIVQEFYDALFAYEPARKIFNEGERPAREETLRLWLTSLAGGSHDKSFWHQQWVVGLVHVKRHVGNSLMLSMNSRIQLLVLNKCLEELPGPEAVRLFTAFKRTTDVITGLIAEGYHQGYRETVEEMTGMKGGLLDRMADVAVDRLLEKARSEG